MSDPTPRPMAADQQRQRRARRWVWGCSAGCFGIILLVVLLLAGAYYLMSPMPIAAPQTFLTQKTTACLFVHVEPGDPVMMGAARDVLRELASAGLEAGGEGDSMEPNQATQFLSVLSPLQCVVTLESDGEGAAHGGMALSVRNGARLLNFIARRSSETPLGKQDGADVVELGSDGRMAVLRNNYMFSADQDLLATWIERLKAESAQRGEAAGGEEDSVNVSPAFKRAYSRMDTSLPLIFVCTNANGELAALSGALGDETLAGFVSQTGLASDSVRSLSGQVQPVGPKAAEVTFLIDCGDRAGAQAMKDRLEAGIAQVGKRWPLGTTSIAVESPGVVAVKGRIEDLPAQAASIVGAVVRHARQTHDEAPHHPDKVPADGPSVSI